jgi:hypothetical protein
MINLFFCIFTPMRITIVTKQRLKNGCTNVSFQWFIKKPKINVLKWFCFKRLILKRIRNVSKRKKPSLEKFYSNH